MSAEASPRANPREAFQSNWYRLVLLFVAVELTVVWFVLGPGNPWYALGVVGETFALGPAMTASLVQRVPRKCFRVPTGESVFHRIAGVGIFGWLLDVSGWNRRVLEPLRGFTGKRAGLPSLEQSVRASAAAHGICFAIHVVLAVLALFSRHPLSGALWMLLPAVVLHLYPVLLQRSILLWSGPQN